jgi:precorrin-6A/cobalt-precorrin-6A reductase
MRPDTILVLAGTAEAREVADRLDHRGWKVISSLAGLTRQPMLPHGTVRSGGFGGTAGLVRFLSEARIGAIVDATHPFAERMSRQAREAAGIVGIPCLRLMRPEWQPPAGAAWTEVATASLAAAALPSAARVLLTIGRQGIAPFLARADLTGLARMIEAPDGPWPHNWQLILARPPFTLEAERALMRAHAITHLVSKNAGGDMTAAKLKAAEELGIAVVLIARPSAAHGEISTTAEALVAHLEALLSP